MRIPILRPVLRPLMRFLLGAIAIPLFRLFLRKVIRLQDMDEELEKDLEEWFRGAILLLAATRNMEHLLFGWLPLDLDGKDQWVGVMFRLLLAIGVIETMPDQELFAVIHGGPPPIKYTREKGVRGWLREMRNNFGAIATGLACQHLNRWSPVLAIMAAITAGWVGWICYVLAIVQYLIIGLVTSKDKAVGVLSEFDRQVAMRRRAIIEEFHLEEDDRRQRTDSEFHDPDDDFEEAYETIRDDVEPELSHEYYRCGSVRKKFETEPDKPGLQTAVS